MKTYWFIAYEVTYTQQGTKTNFNGVIDEHPVDWLLKNSAKYRTEDYVILYALEISRELYDRNEDEE